MKKLFLYANLFFVIGCAQTDLSDRNDIAIIDTRGVDESVFKKDYSECSEFAKNIDLRENFKREPSQGQRVLRLEQLLVVRRLLKKLVVQLQS